MEDLEAVDRYFELLGIQSWKSMPKATPDKRRRVSSRSKWKAADTDGRPAPGLRPDIIEDHQAPSQEPSTHTDEVTKATTAQGHCARKPSHKIHEPS